MAFGAGEGVNVLVVVRTCLAGHFQFSPDRFGEIRACRGGLVLAVFLAQVLLHGSLLSALKRHRTPYMLVEVPRLSSFFCPFK